MNHIKSAFNITDPVIGALVHDLMELDAIKQQQAETARKIERLEIRVQNVELQRRNGVPEGYLSEKQAHRLYGDDLPEDVFHLALAKMGVSVRSYIHKKDGVQTPCVAYLEGEIQPAVEQFLEDAVQCSAMMCQSPMLGGKRFRYIKGEPA